MKLTTWNLNRSGSNNNLLYALNNLPGDIFLFQESFHPVTYLSESEFKKISPNILWVPTVNGWGNMIVTKNVPLTRIPLDGYQGRVLLASVLWHNQKIIIGNLHVPITGGHSQNNLLDIFSRLSPHIKTQPSIIAGDLNIGKCFDQPNETKHSRVIDHILSENNLADAFTKEEKRSFRPHRPEVRINRIDHIFISKAIKDLIIDCDIIENEDIIARSDHNPVTIDINLGLNSTKPVLIPLTDKDIKNQIEEYQDRFSNMDDNQLIAAYIKESGKSGWTGNRARFITALKEEFDSRGITPPILVKKTGT